MSKTGSATKDDITALREQIEFLRTEAIDFVPAMKASEVMRRWIDLKSIDLADQERTVAMAADAVLLAMDLLLAQPSSSGTTAVDRFARTLRPATREQARALLALQTARYRLLEAEASPQGAQAGEAVVLRDAISGERLLMPDMVLPPLPPEAKLFALVAPLGDDLFHAPGAVTPLDRRAADFARCHAAAGMAGAAGSRWAEAVYCHVVRHGTLAVPGLNRPSEGFDAFDFELDANDDDPDRQELLGLAAEWQALQAAAPDPELLLRTRQSARLSVILLALVRVVSLRHAGHGDRAAVLERVLEVQLDTVFRRQSVGSGGLTLAAIEAALGAPGAYAAAGDLDDMRALFLELRRRVTRGQPREDPELFRLVQRIQALRAKTVAQGCTEEEALAAAEKVAELLDRHGLSMTELELRAQPCHGATLRTGRRRSAPIDACVPAIAAFFDCRTWVEQADGEPISYVFFGMRQDVEAALYLYDLVERAFETETERFRRGETYRRTGGARRTVTTSFQVGLGRGIAEKLEALRGARDGRRPAAAAQHLIIVKTALVDEELAKLGLQLTTRRMGGRRRVVSEAFHAGRDAGSRFEVTPAISSAA